MVERYTGIQYDDDLTSASKEYDDSYFTGSDDLFGFTPEESPISRLKNLILSIDWEITDEVLEQLEDELVVLGDVWADDKVKLVYVQALKKLGKYIYQKKSNAHPGAVKLLFTLYHNLERVAISEDMDEEDKKAVLREDIKRFEGLKNHIVGDRGRGEEKSTGDERGESNTQEPEIEDQEKVLFNLKAIVLGIDWEITDEDINDLRREVVKLESLFKKQKSRLLLLRGIGNIGAYIKVKKSDSHADAFKVLQLFYDTLEDIVHTKMSPQEEKALLSSAVDHFKQFKDLLGPTLSSKAIEEEAEGHETLSPALDDVSKSEEKGFQVEEEAARLEGSEAKLFEDSVSSFFEEDEGDVQEKESELSSEDKEIADQVLASLEDQFDEPSGAFTEVDESVALQGVDVEEDDDDEEEELEPVAESIAFLGGDDSDISEESAGRGSWTQSVLAEDEADALQEEPATEDAFNVVSDVALQGVDVETEADDDSEEDALPLLEGELAPALSDYDAGDEAHSEQPDQLDIENRLDTFLGEEEPVSPEIQARPAFQEEQDEPAAKAPSVSQQVAGTEPSTSVSADAGQEDTGTEPEVFDDFVDSFARDEFAPDDGLVVKDQPTVFGAPSDKIEDRLGSFFVDENDFSVGFWPYTELSSRIGLLAAPVAAETRSQITSGLDAAKSYWEENSEERVFVELLSSVSCRLGRYSENLDAQAVDLLKDLHSDLSLCQEDSTDKQRLLNKSTIVVLNWLARLPEPTADSRASVFKTPVFRAAPDDTPLREFKRAL